MAEGQMGSGIWDQEELTKTRWPRSCARVPCIVPQQLGVLVALGSPLGPSGNCSRPREPPCKFTAAASNDWWTKGVADGGPAPP